MAAQSAKELYCYTAPWPVYAMNWCQRPGTFRMGLGSFVPDRTNKVWVPPPRRSHVNAETEAVRVSHASRGGICCPVQITIIERTEHDADFVAVDDVEQPFPCTKLMWAPYKVRA